MLLVACDNKEPDNKPGKVENGNYVGTVSVKQTDGSTYVQDSTEVELKVLTADSIQLIMKQVKFTAAMPISLDMTIPSILSEEKADNSLLLSGNKITPWAMGAPYTAALINSLEGNATETTLVLSFNCEMSMQGRSGVYPLTFSGTKK